VSTIKSSAENLTLNADGANNDIIFQSNGSNVATLDQAGTLTATTFTGAATDSTKVPLAGGTMTGKLTLPQAGLDLPTNNTYITGGGHNVAQVDATMSYFYGGTGGVQFRTANNASALFDIDNTGNVTVTGGDIVFGTAGKGICLGVTSNTDSNTLDDYEEGTFTPTLTGSGSAASYTEQAGNYTKIGNLVHVTIKLACSKGTLSGGVYLDSLPFSAGIDTWGMKFDWYQPYGTALLESGAFFNAGASKLSLYGLTAANNDATAQQFTDSWISGVAKFRLNFSYRTNS
jgi:hypothetical protein